MPHERALADGGKRFQPVEMCQPVVILFGKAQRIGPLQRQQIAQRFFAAIGDGRP